MNLVIPEYKIDLLNKNKKIIKKLKILKKLTKQNYAKQILKERV